MHRCFISEAWLSLWAQNHQALLPKEVVDRFFRVVRVKPNEQVALFDGQGHELRGRLSQNSSGVMIADAILTREQRPKPEMIIMQAALEESKINETIKRGTEFGATKFLLFQADRSEAYLLAKLKKRLDRLEKIALDACRQSGRLFVPSIKIIDQLEANSPFFGVFGDLDAEQRLSQALLSYDQTQDFLITVGPEGGLSDQEKSKLSYLGFKAVSWSPYTLRSELAALAALAIVNAHGGRA